MPPTARKGFQAGEGSEPPFVASQDPPRRPGQSDDVDPHTRVENVAPMVPAIPLEGAAVPGAPAPEVVAGAPVGLAQFLVINADTTLPGQSAAATRRGEYVGWHEPPVELTGQVHEWEDGGDRYVVIARPWMTVILQDKRYLSANRGDVVILLPDTARRGLETGTILPSEQFAVA